jgi:hypothetical protein
MLFKQQDPLMAETKDTLKAVSKQNGAARQALRRPEIRL